jgi:hypothetical protein
MFIIPRVNVIESDEGFSIEVLGMTGLRYTQNDKTLFIDSEILADCALAIEARGINNWDSGEPIEENSKRKILDNIYRAFVWKGIKPKIIDRNQTFTKPVSNVIESDRGFSITRLGLTSLKYVENDKFTTIIIEIIPNTNAINIQENSISKWSSGDKINDETRRKIVFNVAAALKWDGNIVQSTYRK